MNAIVLSMICILDIQLVGIQEGEMQFLILMTQIQHKYIYHNSSEKSFLSIKYHYICKVYHTCVVQLIHTCRETHCNTD